MHHSLSPSQKGFQQERLPTAFPGSQFGNPWATKSTQAQPQHPAASMGTSQDHITAVQYYRAFSALSKTPDGCVQHPTATTVKISKQPMQAASFLLWKTTRLCQPCSSCGRYQLPHPHTAARSLQLLPTSARCQARDDPNLRCHPETTTAAAACTANMPCSGPSALTPAAATSLACLVHAAVIAQVVPAVAAVCAQQQAGHGH